MVTTYRRQGAFPAPEAPNAPAPSAPPTAPTASTAPIAPTASTAPIDPTSYLPVLILLEKLPSYRGPLVGHHWYFK